MIGARIAFTTVVLVRSYSLYSGVISDDTEIWVEVEEDIHFEKKPQRVSVGESMKKITFDKISDTIRACCTSLVKTFRGLKTGDMPNNIKIEFGLQLDNEGNVYLTTGVVAVYNSRGEKIETIVVPEGPANVCFGGKDKHTLFITARTSLYSLRMSRPSLQDKRFRSMGARLLDYLKKWRKHEWNERDKRTFEPRG